MALVAGCAPIEPSQAISPSALATPGPIQVEAVSVRLAQLRGVGPVLPSVTLYEGGRLLVIDGRNAFLERWMTPAGLELVRGEILGTGLFEESADYWFEVREGVEPPAMEVPVDTFQLATEGGVVEVSSVPLDDPAWMVPSPQRRALAELTERLLDLSWLPAQAWTNREPTPYAAAGFLLFAGDLPLVAGVDLAAADMDNVAWPFAGSPDQLGASFVSADGSQTFIDRCAVISPEALAALNAALVAAGAHGLGAGDVAYSGDAVPWRRRGFEIQLELRPLLPEETPTCAGKSQGPGMAE